VISGDEHAGSKTAGYLLSLALGTPFLFLVGAFIFGVSFAVAVSVVFLCAGVVWTMRERERDTV
jgi:hypothetical protein